MYGSKFNLAVLTGTPPLWKLLQFVQSHPGTSQMTHERESRPIDSVRQSAELCPRDKWPRKPSHTYWLCMLVSLTLVVESNWLTKESQAFVCVCEYIIHQLSERVLYMCYHIENKFVMVLNISFISPGQYLHEKRSNGEAEKANFTLA